MVNIPLTLTGLETGRGEGGRGRGGRVVRDLYLYGLSSDNSVTYVLEPGLVVSVVTP